MLLIKPQKSFQQNVLWNQDNTDQDYKLSLSTIRNNNNLKSNLPIHARFTADRLANVGALLAGGADGVVGDVPIRNIDLHFV